MGAWKLYTKIKDHLNESFLEFVLRYIEKSGKLKIWLNHIKVRSSSCMNAAAASKPFFIDMVEALNK